MLDPTDKDYISQSNARSVIIRTAIADEFAQFIQPLEREAWVEGELSAGFFYGIVHLRMAREFVPT